VAGIAREIGGGAAVVRGEGGVGPVSEEQLGKWFVSILGRGVQRRESALLLPVGIGAALE
jgi:hypothetical protein